jgi:hypothetical protein
MSNTYDKYKLTRKVHGKQNLDDPVHEAVVHLAAYSTPDADICHILKITQSDVDAILADPLAQKRLAYKQKLIAKKKVMPKTPEECLSFAKVSLVRLSKSAETGKVQVDALKALASIAIDERKNAPSTAPVASVDDSALLDMLTTKESE